MIKKIRAVRKTKSSEEYLSLCDFFRAVGMEESTTWKTSGFPISRGTSFRGTEGEIEIVDGVASTCEILVEVSDLESAHKVAAELFKYRHREAVEIVVSDFFITAWGARMFNVQIGATELGFWQHEDPEKNRVAAVEGDLNASGMRFGIVVSRWNQVITERLLHGALDALRRSGARREDVTVVRVPGAFELPSAARTLAQTGEVDAVITLGCLIRGETTHYEHIAEEATRGIGQSAQETGVPHAYGLLTCETLEQALDRAGLKAGNKGFEAAMSAVEMVSVGRKLKGF